MTIQARQKAERMFAEQVWNDVFYSWTGTEEELKLFFENLESMPEFLDKEMPNKMFGLPVFVIEDGLH